VRATHAVREAVEADGAERTGELVPAENVLADAARHGVIRPRTLSTQHHTAHQQPISPAVW
jgi:hypothetical protein